MTYHSMIGLISDYDFVITILVGGPETSGGQVQKVCSDLLLTLVPSLEAAGKDEARLAYVGTYHDRLTNSSITLASDDDAPG
jgi:hypothetical protein